MLNNILFFVHFFFIEVDHCGLWLQCKNPKLQFYRAGLADLPSCPCVYPNGIRSNTLIWDSVKKRHFYWHDASSDDEHMSAYKPGARQCIMSNIVPGTFVLASQQCCYDHSFKLITRGQAAGTPNLISPEISRQLHYKVDILQRAQVFHDDRAWEYRFPPV